MANKFPISKPEYDEFGSRITPRMYRVADKKRLVIGIAALIYPRTGKGMKKGGNYAETWRLLEACLGEMMKIRLTENWMRVRLKRLGIGFSDRHPGEMYDFQDEWRVVTLSQQAYKMHYEMRDPEIVIISHHHKNGAAFEIVKGKCGLCKTPVPASLYAYNQLLKLRNKVNG